MSTTKIFNTQLFNFATVLVNRFPDDKELKLGLTAVETLSKINPKKNVEIFTMYVYKYREQIMNKDEKFILETDFISENPDLDSNGASDIMQRLKLNWSYLNADDKENIWKYLKVLITLTDKYIKETLKK
tara:strand:- start:2845 stop:3234 length:390 start_codon:yes stop_codon:yes gene_type:complete